MKVDESEFTRQNEISDRGSSLARTLEDISQLVQGSIPGAVCSVLVRVDGKLEVIAPPGFPDELLRVLPPSCVEDDSMDRIQTLLSERLGCQRCITYPVLSSAKQRLGVFMVQYRDGYVERPSDRELLESASRLAAVALEQKNPAPVDSAHDSITGLLNRSQLITQLDAWLKARIQPSLALLWINFDRFHQINDVLGGLTGDRLLEKASRRLNPVLDSGDLAARVGADEFAVVLINRGNEESALRMAQDLLKIFRAPYRFDRGELFLTASIGVAIFPAHGNSTEDLLRCASVAMREVKRCGGNASKIFKLDGSGHRAERLEVENSLRRALANGELELLYQPVVDLQEKVEGFEALLSWRHPTRGAVPPGEFIPIAEEIGLISEIGSWVMMQACLAGAGWRKAGLQETCISLNVSARQFEQDNFIDTMAVALAISGFPPRCLALELTESCIMQDLARSAERMAQIRELGVGIAIDDFGTGYSSLSYIHKLPVDSIKIDQSFLRGVAEMDGSLPLIQGIVRLAHGMNLTVVAEGVETCAELELIRLVGCDQAQGHLYGQSLRVEEVERLLARDPTGSGPVVLSRAKSANRGV